jgi:hypothetical protein
LLDERESVFASKGHNLSEKKTMLFSFRAVSSFSTSLLCLLVLPLLPACQGTQELGDTDGGASGDCATVCQGRATSCGEPASDATASCAEFCAMSPTSTQLTCIQATSCDDLANDFAQSHYVCGVPLLEEAASGPTPSCSSVCSGRASACGDPDAGDCPALCAKSPTTSQLDCINSTSCSDLAADFKADGTVCGIGSADGG